MNKKIKVIRNELGLTMKEFGQKFDPPASDSIVSRWERGISAPNNKRLKRIAELGGVSMVYLTAENENNLGIYLRKRRKEMKLTIQETADKLEVTQGYLSNIENGKRTPSIKFLTKIAELYAEPMIELLNRISKKTQPMQKIIEISEVLKMGNALGMNNEKLDAFWKQVEHIGKVEQLEYEAMLALGSVFGQMRSEIERLQNLLEGNDGMSVKEIRSQFNELYRHFLNLQTENERYEESLKEIQHKYSHVQNMAHTIAKRTLENTW